MDSIVWRGVLHFSALFALSFVTIVLAGEDPLVEKMAKNPGVGLSTARPGGVSVDYDSEMTAVKALGKGVWIDLLQKIGELDNTVDIHKNEERKVLADVQKGEEHDPFIMTKRKAFLLKVSVIAADLEIKELVPVLFSYLEDRDEPFNDILAVHIGTILKLPDSYHYHRHWFDKEVRAKFRAAVAEALRAK